MANPGNRSAGSWGCRPTANRRLQYGLAVIVWRLNGKPVPRKRSMKFVIAKAK
ncbi:MAG: hypothetical protein R3D80_21535 [Paracoccaceae bacterium]